MANKNTSRTEVDEYISALLETHFGERPAKVNITIEKSFIVIHLQGFLLPSEKILMRRNETKRLLETRMLIMNGLKAEVIDVLKKTTGIEVAEFYADWNLEKETGLFLAVAEKIQAPDTADWPDEIDKAALEKKVINASKETEKEPDAIETYWLGNNLILIERRGIVVEIERQLIKNGIIEELRLAKRPLEHDIMESTKLEPILKQPVSELFVDWDFENEKAYMVLVLESKNP